MMDTLLLPQLKPFEIDQKIRVRLIRLWDSIMPAEDPTSGSVEMVLLDAKGNAMLGTAAKRDSQYLKSLLQEGLIYEMSDFYVGNAKNNFKAVDCQHLITLTRRSKLIQISNPPECYPEYYFDFQLFKSLPIRKDNNKLLTDIIGVVRAMSRVLSGLPKTKTEAVDLQNIKLQDLTGNSINITLWAKNAHILNFEELANKRQNLIIAFTGMTVKEYLGEPNLYSSSATKIYVDPPITEAKLLKRRFEDQPMTVLPLPESDKQRQIASNDLNENPMTIQELLKINVNASKGKTFTCKAKITEIDAGQGWFYNSCARCSKGLRPKGDSYECPDHGDQIPKLTYKIVMMVQDSTADADFIAFGKVAEELIGQKIGQIAGTEDIDKFTLPKPIRALIEQERIFKVNLTRNSYQTGFPTFAINKSFFPPTNQPKRIPAVESSSSTVLNSPSHEIESIQNTRIEQMTLPETLIVPTDLFSSDSPVKPKGVRIREPTSPPNLHAIPEELSQAEQPSRKKIALGDDSIHASEAVNPPHTTRSDHDVDFEMTKRLRTRGKHIKKD